jgi:hypothetical protein
VRKCPNVAMHLYPGPRYDSILLHFAGDSTITRVVEEGAFAFERLDIVMVMGYDIMVCYKV